MNRIQWHNLFS